MKYLLATLALLGLNACVNPANPTPSGLTSSVTLHADRSFSAPERECIQFSQDRWLDQAGAAVEVIYDSDYSTLPDPLSPRNKLIKWDQGYPPPEKDGSQLLGQVWPSGGIHNKYNAPYVEMRLITPRLQNEAMCRLTVMHELGHVLGVDHQEGKDSIMYPQVLPDRTQCLKKADLLAYCEVNDCSGVKLQACPSQEEVNATGP